MKAAHALKHLGGVASLRDLLARTTRQELRCAIEAGEVERLTRDRDALRITEHYLRAAAELSAVSSHLSAAAWWRWPVLDVPAKPQVVVPRHRTVSAARKEGVDLRYRDLGPADMHRPGVTSPLRTVLDCARDLSWGEGLAVADAALRSGLVTSDELSAVPGLCVEPQREVVLPGLTIHPDLVDVRLRLIIEAESHMWHASAPALLRDCERYTLAAVDRWRVARFGHFHVRKRPDWVREMLTLLVATSPGMAHQPASGVVPA